MALIDLGRQVTEELFDFTMNHLHDAYFAVLHRNHKLSASAAAAAVVSQPTDQSKLQWFNRQTKSTVSELTSMCSSRDGSPIQFRHITTKTSVSEELIMPSKKSNGTYIELSPPAPALRSRSPNYLERPTTSSNAAI